MKERKFDITLNREQVYGLEQYLRIHKTQLPDAVHEVFFKVAKLKISIESGTTKGSLK